MQNLDWTLIQSFLAVAEKGSLSGAARQTNQSQPTLGRHIKTIEETLGVTLFTRISKGLALTPQGVELLEPAREMAAASVRMSMLAEGQSTTLKGTVRITASEIVAQYLLPKMIAHFRRAEPEIQLEIVASDSTENLLFREADIAIRMYRPTQLDVITRHVCDLPFALYAAKSYIAERGNPSTAQEIMFHDFVGFDRSDRIIQLMRQMGFPVEREFFGVRTDAQAVYWELIRHGCGIGAAQMAIGEPDPLLERLDLGIDLPNLPVWLTAPEALRTNPRIRRIFDLLAEGFKAL